MTSLLTRAQLRRVDELAVQRYRMPSVVLMENAGRHAADTIDRVYGPAGRACILCGPGNNGGDGCVIARHLHNAGWIIRVVMTADRTKMTPDTATNFAILEAMAADVTVLGSPDAQPGRVRAIGPDEVVIDALLGTGFAGEIRSPVLDWIHAMNTASKRAVVAVDVPSGLDSDTGLPSPVAVRADLTVTFVAAKTGFHSSQAATFLGRVEIADIGVPREAVEQAVNPSG